MEYLKFLSPADVEALYPGATTEWFDRIDVFAPKMADQPLELVLEWTTFFLIRKGAKKYAIATVSKKPIYDLKDEECFAYTQDDGWVRVSEL